MHSIRDQEVDEEFVKLAKERDIWITPNLGGINRSSLLREDGTPAWIHEPLTQETIPPAMIRARLALYESRKKAGAPPNTFGRVYDIVNTRKLHAAGVREVLGGDSAGDSNRWLGLHGLVEFENLAAGGFTPMEVIVAATRESAKALRLDQLGMVAPGKSADFIAARRQPARQRRQRPQDQQGLSARPGGRLRRRRAKSAAKARGFEHDPEKWEPDFGKDHAQTKRSPLTR
jgi:imidazolonepropionase-like amidohydrolase